MAMKKFLKMLDYECAEWKTRGEMVCRTFVTTATVTLKTGEVISPKMGEYLESLDEQVPSYSETGETPRQALETRGLDISHVAEIVVTIESSNSQGREWETQKISAKNPL